MFKREQYSLWIPAALITALLAALGTSSTWQRGVLGSVLGRGMYGGVVCLVLITVLSTWWRTAKERGRPSFISSVFALPIIATCGWLLAQSQHFPAPTSVDANAQAVVANIQHTVEPAGEPKLTVANRTERARAYANSPSDTTGEPGKNQRELKAYLAKTLSLRDQLKATSVRINWVSIFDPTRLKTDTHMTQSVAMVSTMLDATHRYVTSMHRLIGGLPKELRRSMSSETKRLLFEELGLQQQKVEQAAQLIGFLKKINGQWHIGKGHILFNQQSDADEYNQYLRKLSTTHSKIQAVSAKRLALARRAFKRLQGVTK